MKKIIVRMGEGFVELEHNSNTNAMPLAPDSITASARKLERGDPIGVPEICL
jgi:hypothetical protein